MKSLHTFKCDGFEFLVDSMQFLTASSKKALSTSLFSFVVSEDGKFAVRLARREQPLESVFRLSRNRLVSWPIRDDSARAIAELNRLQALFAKAATTECQEQSFRLA